MAKFDLALPWEIRSFMIDIVHTHVSRLYLALGPFKLIR